MRGLASRNGRWFARITRRRPPLFTASLTFAGLVLFALRAQGSAAYPSELKSALALSKEPPCTVCHSDGDAGMTADAGLTADTSFARALELRGLVGDSVDSLSQALAPMVDVDSDGDGARDLDELAWGGDPNQAEGPEAQPASPPSYGCGVTSQTSTRALPVASLMAGLALTRRRRARAGNGTQRAQPGRLP